MKGWITTDELADLAEISVRVARKVLYKTLTNPLYTWHGSRVEVKTVKGRGGKAGMVHLVKVDSLPPALELAWNHSQNGLEGHLRTDNEAIREAQWWEDKIAPILAHAKHTKTRGRAIATLADHPVMDWNLQPVTLNAHTIRSKLDAYDAYGLRGLIKAHRADKGKKHVIVTRNFDNAARAQGIGDDALQDASQTLHRYIRSVFAEGTSVKLVREMAKAKLKGIADSLGIIADSAVIAVPENVVNEDKKAGQRVATYRFNRKAFEDAKPRITRGIGNLRPMDLVIGDISPVDILMRRLDGTIATARLIAWADVATHRVYCSLVLCEAGTGIRNEHVTRPCTAGRQRCN